MAPRAVVFAYHSVGVRCLATLLAHGVEVELVVTHRDSPGENIWFDSVAQLASRERIPCIAPDSADDPDLAARIARLRPDFIFSFYYRYMIDPALLALAARGAYNMHGSLLPRYRGRVPVNWAILRGEAETGASLHRMVAKPDAGALVGQQRVPILPNDTARHVFDKVICAAEMVLDGALPALIDGTFEEKPLDLTAGEYCGRRTPEDGRIDWTQGAWSIHNLVRAVAPPYPGAFFDYRGSQVHLFGSHYRGESAVTAAPRIYWEDGRCLADCADGRRFQVLDIRVDGEPIDEAACRRRLGEEVLSPADTGNRSHEA